LRSGKVRPRLREAAAGAFWSGKIVGDAPRGPLRPQPHTPPLRANQFRFDLRAPLCNRALKLPLHIRSAKSFALPLILEPAVEQRIHVPHDPADERPTAEEVLPLSDVRMDPATLFEKRQRAKLVERACVSPLHHLLAHVAEDEILDIRAQEPSPDMTSERKGRRHAAPGKAGLEREIVHRKVLGKGNRTAHMLVAHDLHVEVRRLAANKVLCSFDDCKAQGEA
jgi:hypothetical protein